MAAVQIITATAAFPEVMKNKDPNNSDEGLCKLLKEWRCDATLPPRFQEAVWQRIERAAGTTQLAPISVGAWSVVAHWIGTMLPRPALATAYVAILLVVGVSAGWTQGRQETSRIK